MQRRKAVFVGELIRQCISNSDILVKGMQEADVVNAWREIVGETLYSYTTRLYIRDQKLFVEFSSAVAKKEFYGRRYQILNELNKIAGKTLIKFIYVI